MQACCVFTSQTDFNTLFYYFLVEDLVHKNDLQIKGTIDYLFAS